MKIAEIRKMKAAEIEKEVAHAYDELKNSSDDISSGKEKDVSKSLKIRRKIARMLTVLNETKNEAEISKSDKKEK